MENKIIPSVNYKIISNNINADIPSLALKLHDLKKKDTDIDPEYILRQIQGFQSIKNKIPEWYENKDLLFPKGISMQQCSSSLTANYKSHIVEQTIGINKNIADITGGFGVDFFFITKNQKSGLYIEKQDYLADVVKHNISTLRKKNNTTCISGNSIEILQKLDKKYELIFVDPARRDSNGKKVDLLEDCEPNIIEIKEQLFQFTDYILIKLSPMLDITAALNQLIDVSKIYVISVNNECKELLFLLSKNNGNNSLSEKIFNCINIVSTSKREKLFELTYSENEYNKSLGIEENISDKIDTYLYEPNSSIMKASAYTLLCKKYIEFNLKKIEQNSHLFTNNIIIKDFPGRTFKVLQTIPYSEKKTKRILSKIDKANITVRNFPDSVSTIRKKMKIKEGGNTYIFATTLNNNKKVLIISIQI